MLMLSADGQALSARMTKLVSIREIQSEQHAAVGQVRQQSELPCTDLYGRNLMRSPLDTGLPSP